MGIDEEKAELEAVRAEVRALFDRASSPGRKHDVAFVRGLLDRHPTLDHPAGWRAVRAILVAEFEQCRREEEQRVLGLRFRELQLREEISAVRADREKWRRAHGGRTRRSPGVA